jgi:hypothetical protein
MAFPEQDRRVACRPPYASERRRPSSQPRC